MKRKISFDGTVRNAVVWEVADLYPITRLMVHSTNDDVYVKTLVSAFSTT